MDNYIKNLNYLKKTNYSLYKQILDLDEVNYITEIENTSNCIVEYAGKRCFLQSVFNTSRENIEIFKNIKSDTSLLIHFGIGYLSSVEHLKKKYTSLNEIILIEPDLNIFKIVLKKIDLELIEKSYFKINIITTNFNDDENKLLSYKIQYYIKKGIDFSYSISYRTLYSDAYEKAHQKIMQIIKSIKVQYATANFFRDKWIDNFFSNIQSDDIHIEELFGKFNNRTAIMVSAGPSLNKNIDDLKKFQGKLFIAAVGTSARILQKNNITPDLCFALDGNETELKIFQDIETEKSILCYSNTLYKGVLPIYRGQKIRMVTEGDVLTEYLYKNSGIGYQNIYSGYSVANTAIDVLSKMGFEKIILLGQDLCFTNGDYHAKGSFLPDNFKLNFDNTYLVVENIYGEKVYTTSAFMAMKESFEAYIRKNEKVNIINCTQGGLSIKGIKNSNLRDEIEISSIDKFDFKIIVNNLLIDSHKSKFNQVLKYGLDAMKKEIGILQELNNKKYEKLIEVIDKYSNINTRIKKIEELDSFEDLMEKVSFYNGVARKMLAPVITPIHLSLKYDGKDINKVANSLEKILTLQYIEFKNFYDILMNKIYND